MKEEKNTITTAGMASGLEQLAGAIDQVISDTATVQQHSIGNLPTAGGPEENEKPAVFMSPRALDSLGYNDHQPESGIGELVDNAQEAGATIIQVFTKTDEPEPRKRIRYVNEIAVVDNGGGMTYGVLKQCLVLGKSMRTQISGKKGIGRFGVGMTTGSLALAHRIEVYSRTEKTGDFWATYIDTKEMMEREENLLPLPFRVSATDDRIAEYAGHLEASSGTIVVLRKIWIKYAAKDLEHTIGRTYRKFIEAGIVFKHNGNQIYLHDPLYMAGPTKFDAIAIAKGNNPDPKASLYGNIVKLSYDVPGEPGRKMDVEIRISLLPQEWWLAKNSGGNKFAKERKIHENEGVSILRADREVFYGKIGRLFGTSSAGSENFEDIDRWWGCEISFPPELDHLFEVRFVKAGVVPKEVLRDTIRDVLGKAIKTLRDKIKNERKAFQAGPVASPAEKDPYVKPEEIMSDASKRMKRIQQGGEQDDAEKSKKKNEVLDRIVDKRLDAEKYNDSVERAKKKQQLSNLPLVISPRADFFSRALFYPEYLPGQIVLHLNVKHPFYTKVLEPLCGQLGISITDNELPENATVIKNEYLVHRSEVKNAIFLLLFSLAKGEEELLNEYAPKLDDDVQLEEALRDYRENWGTALATAVRTAEKGRASDK